LQGEKRKKGKDQTDERKIYVDPLVGEGFDSGATNRTNDVTYGTKAGWVEKD